MEQDKEIETFETSLLANMWAERRFIGLLIVVIIISSIYGHLNSIQFFEEMLGMFFFIGIALLGFVAIAAHVKYYFHFDRNRKVELFTDRMIISLNSQVTEQILKTDIIKITLYDKRHVNEANLFPTVLDSFYYLIVIGKNKERVVLTCLLDIKLKKKIAAWYGHELEHEYQFFPFPQAGAGE